MSEFDSTRGAFWLVAIVIATQMVIVLLIAFGCVLGRLEAILPLGSCKGVMEQMQELFQMCFTAAIAFAGGRMSAPSPTKPQLPNRESDK